MVQLGTARRPGASAPGRRTVEPAARARSVPWPAVALAAWVVVILAVDLVWLARFRSGVVPEYDESGYMAMALHDLHAFQHDGLPGLWRAYLGGAPSAPLVPLLTLVPFLIAGGSVGVSVATQLAAVIGLAIATYALGRRMMAPGWAALAAAVTVSLPVVADFSRTFHFAVPTAALLTGSAWALARSDRLRRPGWALLAGALLGAMALSRTMAVAYLPGIGAAALVLAVAPGPHRRARLRSLALLVATTAVVAATWFLPHGNARAVGHYLLGTGYGERSSSYGAVHSPASAAYWLKEAGVVGNDVQLPVAVALVAAAVAGAVALASRRRADRWVRQRPFHGARWRSDLGATVRRLTASPLLIPAAIVAEGYLALTSSRNNGTGFTLPWLPSLILLCVYGASRLQPRAARTAIGALLIASALLAVAVKSDFVGPLATRRTVHVPVVGTVAVTDGDWLARGDVDGDGYRLGPPDRPLPALHRQWLPFAQREMAAVVAYARARGAEPWLEVGTGDVVLSTTRFALGAELGSKAHVMVERLQPAAQRDDYRAALAATPANVLVTADPPPGGADVDTAAVRAAAASAGFVPFRTSTAPDGRAVTWWWRA